MSCYLVTVSDGVKVMSPVTSAEEYRRLRNTLRQQSRVRMARKGTLLKRKDKEGVVQETPAKTALVQFCYSCLPADAAGRLKGSVQVSNSVGMDVDLDPTDPLYEEKMTQFPALVLAKKEELGLLMLERSATKGFHVVFRRRTELSQEENLTWASRLIGVKFDTGAKDITRVFFTTTASDEDLLFLDEGLFDNRVPVMKAAATVAEERGAKAAAEERVAADQGNDRAAAGAVAATKSTAALTYHGLPYSRIVDKYWELYNHGRKPAEGDRNVKTFELAVTLRAICDYSQEMLEAVIPRYDNMDTEEWRTTIGNALKEPRKGMPYRLTQVLQALRKEMKMEMLGGTMVQGEAQLPQLPAQLPEVLRLLASKVPTKLKAMVVESVWPALCAHLVEVKFRYTDGVLHEPNICSPLIGRQSIGKGHVNQPIEHLLADITQRDRENDERLKEWRRRNQGKANTKDRQPRPEDVCVQRLDDDLTPAALAQALIDAERNGCKRIITKVDEIELLNKVANGKNQDVALLVRYGFDTARWGQRRVSVDSVNGSYAVRWVWNASCTLKAAKKFINTRWIADGSLSRLNLNALLLPPDDHDQPVVGEYDEEFDRQLRPFVERLNAACGTVECPQANRLAKALQREHRRAADLCESEGYRTFSYRAVLIGWLKALMLYIMNDYRWSHSIETYVRYAVKRDLWLKMYFFGEEIENEFREEENTVNHGPSDLLAPLPEEFTYEDYLGERQRQGRTGDAKATLRVWKHRGYVEYDEVSKTWHKKIKGSVTA